MYKLALPPDQSGYSVAVGEELVSTKLDGGASRSRLDILNASSTVSCSWTVGPENYKYLRQFYVVNVKNGGEQFTIDLILDDYIPTEYKAKFVANSWGLQSQRGHTYTVSAQLEIEAIDYDFEYVETIVMLVGEYGSVQKAYEILNLLNKLVNYDLAGVPFDG